MAIEKLERNSLVDLLKEVLENSPSYKFLGGVNPCKIILESTEYYIYIKNITPTAFPDGNPEIVRIQLPKRKVFEEIKQSSAPFIFLGYDSLNDVYVTWNPYTIKQRLNVSENVSLYSRLHLQQNAGSNKEFLSMILQNDIEVLAFPRERIADFLINMQVYFPEMIEYVAVGSKRRREANETFRTLNDGKNIKFFARYLNGLNLSNITVNRYYNAILKLINKGHFSHSRKIFLAYDSFKDYYNTIQPFFEIDEISKLNNESHYTYSAALNKYIDFLIEYKSYSEDSEIIEKEEQPSLFDDNHTELSENNESSSTIVEEPKPENIPEEYKTNENNWEELFTNQDGVLTRIANPELIDKLRPCLDTEYRKTAEALAIIEDFYPDRYNNMQLKDWQNLFSQIDWSNPYYDPSMAAEPSGKQKTHILRVTYPDGSVIEKRKVSDTLVEVIKKSDPDLINEMNIKLANVNLVSKTVNEKYAFCQKEIQDGWYVMTLCSTDKKQEILQKISDELNLDLKIEQIAIVDNVLSTPKEYAVIHPKRIKIKVTFPNGRVVYEVQVMKTLLEVVAYAKPEKVRSLNIIVNNDNLITSNIIPKYKINYKPVGNNLFCNTNTNTQTKFEQIQFISNKLDLGLKVELI